MRSHHLTAGVVAALGSMLVAAPCGTGSGPGARTFASGALVIPMDNCYQKRDAASAPGGQTQSCNATSDDGVFSAYGVVYFLLKHNITVYWAIDAATPKTSLTGADIAVPAPGAGNVAVKKYNWATDAIDVFSPAFPTNTGITYIGGPFVVDPADKAAALSLFATSPDFAAFKANGWVDIHEVEVGFTAPQVRALVGPPPRIAILDIGGASANVMYDYAKDAGLDWPCAGTGDCAGGVTGGPGGCDPGTLKAATTGTFNSGAGLVYDMLCDGDFLPDPGTGAPARLLTNGYKLLWAPHWAGGADPNGSTAADLTLAVQLQSIAAFVDAGSDLFAECHSVATFEGGYAGTKLKEPGYPATRFQTTLGMRYNGGNATALFVPPAITNPNTQIGDFVFTPTGGSITDFYANEALTPTPSYYRPGPPSTTWVQRLITENVSGTYWDVYTLNKKDDVQTKGNVVYFGGHTYATQTAGTRLVLNTLFNLGFGCADPNTVCNTGRFGICAAGHLKCDSGGGLQCAQDTQPLPQDLCDGKDENCDGIVDGGCTPTVCTPGQTRPCFAGATNCADNGNGTFTCGGKVTGCVDNGNGTFTCATSGTAICRLGTETCSSSGAWGTCTGEVHPGPEVCNGKDDDCNGATDEGDTCYPGYHCSTAPPEAVSGVCLPDVCGVEVNVCPAGFTCDTNGACQPVACGSPPVICTAPGQVCLGTACQDPCQNVTCGPGAACSGGACTGGACYSYGCPSGQVCVAGKCAADPCAGSSCPTGTFCRGGDCVRSCVYVKCGAGQICNRDGFCETPACNPPCVSGQVCQSGACVPDPACSNVPCGAGQVCRAGNCGDAPCSNVHCPVGTCAEDQCQGELPPGEVPTNGGKKSGCGCSSAGGLEVLSLGLVALALGTRRRRVGRSAPLGR